jgi:hypothetical protein
MKRANTKDIAAIFREGTPIDRAIAAGARDAIRRHKQAGVPVVIWRRGKPVWVEASELESKPRNARGGRGKKR